MTFPAGRHPTGTPVAAATANGDAPRAAPGTYPVPAGRGRWRLMLLNRAFVSNQTFGTLAIGELGDARSRRLERKWCEPATLSFAVDGQSSSARDILELQTDVVALRWDDQTGTDVMVFRGPVTQSQDQISEQTHTVTFTCHDYAAVLWRRITVSTYTTTQTGQDAIVQSLLGRGNGPSAGGTFSPGSFLPIVDYAVNPDGTTRDRLATIVRRDRTYPPNTVIGQAIADLGKVENGFDWDMQPFGSGASGLDWLRLFYPYQGVTRSTPALVYGSTISSLSRSVNSADYANYVRIVGNKASSDPAAPQLYGEAWNADANDITRIAVGLWSKDENASDVSLQTTLNEQVAGELATYGTLIPNYTLELVPGAYSWTNPNMGDVVPLVVQSGRLNVNTTVRVLGFTYDIGDDGDENVGLTVGRPAVTLPNLLRQGARDTNALARR